MYLNGMGFRAIARVTDIDHAIIINWVKERKRLSDEPQGEELPEITEIDELQTFVGCKKNKFWVGSVVNHWNQGILLWTVGDRSHETFEQIWQIIARCGASRASLDATESCAFCAGTAFGTSRGRIRVPVVLRHEAKLSLRVRAGLESLSDVHSTVAIILLAKHI